MRVNDIDPPFMEEPGEPVSDARTQAGRLAERRDIPAARLDLSSNAAAQPDGDEAWRDRFPVRMPGEFGEKPLHPAGVQLLDNVGDSQRACHVSFHRHQIRVANVSIRSMPP